MSERLFVPVVGLPCSGKSTVVSHMTEKWGFKPVRVSQQIEIYAAAHGLTLRSRADYLACHALMIEEDPDLPILPAIQASARRIAIDGLRVVEHTDRLAQFGKVVPIALIAHDRTRFERAQENAAARGNRDAATFEEFLNDEDVEHASDYPYGPNLDLVMERAIITINTEDKSVERVREYTDLVLQHLLNAPSAL